MAATVLMDLKNVPEMKIEKEYWSRKLPPGFQFYMEMLARELMICQPPDVANHAATFFEELTQQHDFELSQLPQKPYIQKLKMKRGLGSSNKSVGPMVIHQPFCPMSPDSKSLSQAPCYLMYQPHPQPQPCPHTSVKPPEKPSATSPSGICPHCPEGAHHEAKPPTPAPKACCSTMPTMQPVYVQPVPMPSGSCCSGPTELNPPTSSSCCSGGAGGGGPMEHRHAVMYQERPGPVMSCCSQASKSATPSNKCGRCGKSLTKEPKSKEKISSCAKCGVDIKTNLDTGDFEHLQPDHSYESYDQEVKVIALKQQTNAFGRIARRISEKHDTDAIPVHSMAILFDY